MTRGRCVRASRGPHRSWSATLEGADCVSWLRALRFRACGSRCTSFRYDTSCRAQGLRVPRPNGELRSRRGANPEGERRRKPDEPARSAPSPRRDRRRTVARSGMSRKGRVRSPRGCRAHESSRHHEPCGRPEASSRRRGRHGIRRSCAASTRLDARGSRSTWPSSVARRRVASL